MKTGIVISLIGLIFTIISAVWKLSKTITECTDAVKNLTVRIDNMDTNNEKDHIEMPILRKGSIGEAVKTLQRLLRQLQYVNLDGKTLLIVDGNFGSNTEAAVKRWQQKHLNGVDGIVGVKTWNKLLNGR